MPKAPKHIFYTTVFFHKTRSWSRGSVLCTVTITIILLTKMLYFLLCWSWKSVQGTYWMDYRWRKGGDDHSSRSGKCLWNSRSNTLRLLSIQSNQQHFQKSVAFGCRLRKYFPCFMDIQTQVILRLVLRYLSAVHATFNQVDQVDPRAIQDLFTLRYGVGNIFNPDVRAQRSPSLESLIVPVLVPKLLLATPGPLFAVFGASFFPASLKCKPLELLWKVDLRISSEVGRERFPKASHFSAEGG